MWHFYQHTAGKGETHQLFYSRCTVLYVCRVVSRCEVCFCGLNRSLSGLDPLRSSVAFFSVATGATHAVRQNNSTNISWEEESRGDGNNSSYRISPLKLPEYAFNTLL